MSILRIKFVIPTGYSFDLENFTDFSINFNQYSLRFEISMSESESYRSYIFKSNEFDFTFEDEQIQKIIDSLYLISLEFGNGLLINSNLKSSWVAKSFLEELISEHKVNFEDDFIGVKVLPKDTIIMSSGPITIHCKSSIKSFEEGLNKYVNLKFSNSEKIIRAIEIYNSSSYLNVVNQSARFILQMTAIEALIEQPKVSKRLQNSIDSYRKRVKLLKIKSDEKSSIIGSLSLLKNTSIKRSGKLLVQNILGNERKYNGFSPCDFFSKAYDLRSNFVHFGMTKTKELDIKTIQMQTFTSDLLKAYFNKICC
jgi:hypothetical protein